jgi:hypothetical protein
LNLKQVSSGHESFNHVISDLNSSTITKSMNALNAMDQLQLYSAHFTAYFQRLAVPNEFREVRPGQLLLVANYQCDWFINEG